MAKVVFITADGSRREVNAPTGFSLLDIAHRNDINIEGACEGQMACSTCHVVIDSDWHAKLSPPSEEEEDLLDLVFGLTRTSRLACQVTMTDTLDGLTVKLPRRTRNLLLED
ncbi:MAG: 2Fe-2S ferredoxin [Rhodospirillaceae bacterium]|nr:2Fe-2S ferredoxin [Rhodospirillaceae bacterium]